MRFFRILKVGFILCCMGWVIGSLQPLQAQSVSVRECQKRIERAERLEAYPDQVIELLKDNICEILEREWAVRRYRALAEAYLLQVPPNVDSAAMMWQRLLFRDPEYLLDSTSSEELQRLSRRFSTRPALSFELFLGAHAPFVMAGTQYGPQNLNNQGSDYTAFREPRVSGQIGAGIWYNLNSRFKNWKRIRRWTVGAQVQFRTTTYEYEQWLSTALPAENSFALLQMKERHTALDLTLGVRHQFDRRLFAYNPVPRFRPFIQFDIQPAWLLESRITTIERRSVSPDPDDPGGFVETDGRITGIANSRIMSIRRPLGVGAGLGVGLNAKVRLNYLAVLLRYHVGLSNQVDPRNRYGDEELVYKYGYVDDNWTMHRLELSFSYWFTVYYPSRKSRKIR